MDSDTGIATVGFYGKLPAKGDFLSRHLPREFVSAWDDWLQSGLNASRAGLGDQWKNIYLTSPIWRFALSPGNCGECGWIGLFMPSMDRVGRCFPFAVARALPENRPPLDAAIGQQSWLSRVEELSLTALDDDDIDLAEFDESLAAATTTFPDSGEPSDGTGIERIATMDLSAGVRLPMTRDLNHDAVLRGVASNWMDRQFARYSLWWTEGSQIVTPSLLFFPGLPVADRFSALLDGGWTRQGWCDAGETDAKQPAEDSPLADAADT